MKKVSKAILIALAVILALGVCAVFGVNLYLQSPAAQARIEDELSRALRLPLKITNTSLLPGSDLRITGITIPHEGVNFLEATSFRAHYRLFPLLRGRLEIPEIRVDAPKIIWVQTAAGKWEMPGAEPTAPSGEPPGRPAPSPPSEPDPSKLPEQHAEKSAKAPKHGFLVTVDRFRVTNGSVELLDHAHQPVATFTEVNLSYSARNGERLEGEAQIGSVTWQNAFRLENVRSPFTRTEQEFVLPEITATFAGGPVQGRFRTAADEAKSPYEGALSFTGASLDSIATSLGGQPGQASGQLAGHLDFRGTSQGAGKLEGKGRLDLRAGQLRQLELFQSIGQALGIRELADFRLGDSYAEFHLGNEKVIVDQLQLSATDLAITAKGTVRFDRKVSLAAQLALADTLVQQLPQIVRDSFATAETGERTIAFNVTGTTAKPKTNLLDKLIGQRLNAQFDDLLSGIFGTRKKDDEKKKEEERKKAEKQRARREKARLPGELPAASSVPAAVPDSTPAIP